VIAQPLGAKFYTNTLDAVVGDEINLQLKINPRADLPIYTVSADLIYNPISLEYVESAYSEDSKVFGVSKPPHFLEDVQNGMIRLTGGYPTGAKSLVNFTRYKFKAVKPGLTKIYIQGGKALDAENNDIGVEQKEITINIISTCTAEVASEVESTKREISLVLEILGPIAIYKEVDYTFQVLQPQRLDSRYATLKVYVYNDKTELFFEKEMQYVPDEDRYLSFTIPADTLEEGSYVISGETTYEDGTTEVTSQKNIGVLSNGETWFTRNKTYFIPLFIFMACMALIHHIAVDRDLYARFAELRRLKRKKKV
jgi:hypothetical protein